MIREAFCHLPGVGPETLKAMHGAGLRSWSDIVQRPQCVPLKPRAYESVLNEIFRCERAVADGDIAYLVKAFEPRDHWRILGHWFDRAAFFDIETEGVEHGSPVTVVALLHRGRLSTFVRGENLDAFLDALDDIELLVSFNGASFDVPRILRHYNVPSLPCPHIDLRWLCYHGGHEGGLKRIETGVGIERPADLRGIDGKDAELFWKLWTVRRDAAARARLVRYCAADVLALQFLAAHLLRGRGIEAAVRPDLWQLLDGLPMGPAPAAPAPLPAEAQKLQARWNRMRALRARSPSS